VPRQSRQRRYVWCVRATPARQAIRRERSVLHVSVAVHRRAAFGSTGGCGRTARPMGVSGLGVGRAVTVASASSGGGSRDGAFRKRTPCGRVSTSPAPSERTRRSDRRCSSATRGCRSTVRRLAILCPPRQLVAADRGIVTTSQTTSIDSRTACVHPRFGDGARRDRTARPFELMAPDELLRVRR
jgi:hypothetical protein